MLIFVNRVIILLTCHIYTLLGFRVNICGFSVVMIFYPLWHMMSQLRWLFSFVFRHSTVICDKSMHIRKSPISTSLNSIALWSVAWLPSSSIGKSSRPASFISVVRIPEQAVIYQIVYSNNKLTLHGKWDTSLSYISISVVRPKTGLQSWDDVKGDWPIIIVSRNCFGKWWRIAKCKMFALFGP